jgi:hypothetical protein
MEVCMRRLVLAAWIVSVLAVPAHAQVQVNVGIHLPGPPTLAVVPGAPVYYAPRAPANVFFYGSQYWVFHGNGWFIGPTWNGPWAVVAPMHVPVPILRVPVRYYHVPPGHWKRWRADAPPRWDGHWGREWHESVHEREWREREEHWKHDKRDDGHRGRGHGKH